MAKKLNTSKKHKAVVNYFYELYDKRRLRYDDCLTKTADTYFYSETTVEDILRFDKKTKEVA